MCCESLRVCVCTGGQELRRYDLALSWSLSHHQEGEIAIAEQAEDDERHGEEGEPQHDVHLLLPHGPHDPGLLWQVVAKVGALSALAHKCS